MNVMILGPAGSGKSLLTASFGKFLEKEGYTVKFVNIDPGCAVVPYTCDYDVRRKFTVEEIMQKERLGPNGAMLKAMEKLCRIRLPNFDADFTLIDTPGQLEIFAFHDSGPKIVNQLGNLIGIFLIDGTVGVGDLPAVYLYALAVRYRLGINMITVVNKADLLSKMETERIRKYLLNPTTQKKSLKAMGALADIYIPLSKLLENVVPAQRIPMVSARNEMGFNELLDMLYEVKCICGDLT